MTHRLLGFAILLFICLLTQGIAWMIKTSPNIIAGYKSKNSKSSDEEKKWVDRLAKSLRIGTYATLTGGIIALVAGSKPFFVLSLTFPLSVAVIYAANAKKH